MSDLLATTDELQDILGQNFTTPEVDEAELEDELTALCSELDSGADYLNDVVTPSVPSALPGENLPTPATGKTVSEVRVGVISFYCPLS